MDSRFRESVLYMMPHHEIKYFIKLFLSVFWVCFCQKKEENLPLRTNLSMTLDSRMNDFIQHQIICLLNCAAQ